MEIIGDFVTQNLLDPSLGYIFGEGTLKQRRMSGKPSREKSFMAYSQNHVEDWLHLGLCVVRTCD